MSGGRRTNTTRDRAIAAVITMAAIGCVIGVVAGSMLVALIFAVLLGFLGIVQIFFVTMRAIDPDD